MRKRRGIVLVALALSGVGCTSVPHDAGRLRETVPAPHRERPAPPAGRVEVADVDAGHAAVALAEPRRCRPA